LVQNWLMGILVPGTQEGWRSSMVDILWSWDIWPLLEVGGQEVKRDQQFHYWEWNWILEPKIRN
jgi:hypothetical protein